jgi:hypothetical protein
MMTAHSASRRAARATAPAGRQHRPAARLRIADLLTVAALAPSEQSSKDALSLRFRRFAIKAEGEELIRLWRDNEISDEVIRLHDEIMDCRKAQL